MTDTQLYIAIGAPMLFNGVLITFVVLYMNARFDAVNAKFDAVDAKFDAVSARFTSIDRHLDSLEKV